MRDPFVFTRLHLPRPLEAKALHQLLARLMSSDVPRPLALECQAGEGEIAYLLGSPVTAVQRLKRLLRGVVPGIQFEAAKRADMAQVARVASTSPGLPLGDGDSPELVVSAIFAAFASRRGQEVVTLQLVLGQAHRPTQLPRNTADPTQSLPSRLLEGARPAPPDVQRRLKDTHAAARLDVTVRIGVLAETPKRQTSLTHEVFGALQLLESPGGHLTLLRDATARGVSPVPGRRPLRLTAAQLLPFLAWPLGEHDYPGVVPVHPRRLPAAEILTSTEGVFALSTAPGPERPIGLDTASRLQHVVALGPTGSGKSTLLEHLILSDIKARRACVVIEPKQQLIDSILEKLSPDMSGRVVVMDASDPESVVGLNPLDVGDRDPYVVADGNLAALAAVFTDGWGPRTEYLIQGALTSLCIAGQKRGEPYTLLDLPRILTDAPFRRGVVAAVKDDPTLQEMWTEFDDMRPGQRAAVVAAPLNKLRKLVMRKHLAAVLGQPRPRFRLRDVFRERLTVLVPLNEALIGSGAATLLGSLIVAELFLATQERAAEKNPQKRPGMVFIDEVQNYLHLPTPLDNALGVFRSYGVGLHLAHQHRDQLSPKMRAAVDSNARNRICFSLEAADAADMAKQAPQLTAKDFQTLPIREIYARLLAGGIPTEWCSAKTLPPAAEVGAAEVIRQASRDAFGALPTEPQPVGSLSDSDTAASSAGSSEQADASPRRSHQRRRRS